MILLLLKTVSIKINRASIASASLSCEMKGLNIIIITSFERFKLVVTYFLSKSLVTVLFSHVVSLYPFWMHAMFSIGTNGTLPRPPGALYT